MNGTPRLRSAFPATPATDLRRRRTGQLTGSLGSGQQSQSIPSLDALKPSSHPEVEPVVPFHVIDAPTQRLYAFVVYVALFMWRLYDFGTLQESEEQSLWLFMKWIFLDGVYLFALPSARIPWLQWSSATMTLLFCAHALLDGMLMFRIPLPIEAALAALGRSVWGAYELAVNEHNVNPQTIRHNGSLILGRQIIHVLPEGSAIMNAERQAFCIDSIRKEVHIPITINSTNPISMDILRMHLDNGANETMHVTKRQIKSMHDKASRLMSYSDRPNEPKTLYYTVSKPGLYVLAKVVDESNLEVARKRLAHTVVVPCPNAVVKPSGSDKCRGELSSVELEVNGTPPLKVKYRKMVDQRVQESSFESIQPEDFFSPLARQDQSALVVPNRVDATWARSRKVSVPLSEQLGTSGRWVYSIDEIKDGFGNTVNYSVQDFDSQEKHMQRSPHLHQVVNVHERPTVNLVGCDSQRPLKVAKGSHANLPLKYGSTAQGGNELTETAYHLNYIFTPEQELTSTGEHGVNPSRKMLTMKSTKQQPQIQEPGLYTLIGVSTDFCEGEVMEPASCLLQNPPQPDLSITREEIFDKCAGSPIGLRVDLDLLGTPPFHVRYRMLQQGQRHHIEQIEEIKGHRGQLELTPTEAGHYTYDFVQISDAVYKAQSLKHKNLQIEQDVKPSASARFTNLRQKLVACIDEPVEFELALQGEGPFAVEYELLHGSTRDKFDASNIEQGGIKIQTPPLTEGGDYTLALTSVTDRMGCKEFLKEEAKISVRHQKPKVGFGQIDGSRSIEVVESQAIQIPLRLAGEAPWTITYLDRAGNERSMTARDANDRIPVTKEGIYELIDLKDATCPGTVDEAANKFEVSWIPRPEMRIPPSDVLERKGDTLVKADICEGEEDTVEVFFKGSPPYHMQYQQHVKPVRGAVAPKNKDLRAALNVASLRMDTAQAGLYEYRFNKLGDANYDHSQKHFGPLAVQQRVHEQPSAAFVNPGKTYSFCSVESEGDEIIPITLHGAPPFEVEVEIKHFGSIKPEIIAMNGITSHQYKIGIPKRQLHLGKSAISLRRVSDGVGCSRLLDSTTPRVQISVHDAPTITPLETQEDYCVGDRINFGLSGVAPFSVFYNFESQERKASAQGTTFRRLAERPGTFTVIGLTDAASQCRATTSITKRIHGMPSVRVSKGRESSVDIHEGDEAEILFEFGGVPPFEFTYTRSANAEKGRRTGAVLEMKSETSEDYSMRIRASQEGTYEVVAIKDRYCAYAKPGVKVVEQKAPKRLQF